jgi:reactive intermediate/imine deaminase
MAEERSWTPVTPAGIPAPKGAYTPAVRAGDTIYVSGQVPVDFTTGAVVGETVAEQTRAVLDRVRTVLEAEGAGLHDVVSVTAVLADIGDWAEFDAAYRAVMPQPYPARITTGASLAGVRVEIGVVAYRPLAG